MVVYIFKKTPLGLVKYNITNIGISTCPQDFVSVVRMRRAMSELAARHMFEFLSIKSDIKFEGGYRGGYPQKEPSSNAS